MTRVIVHIERLVMSGVRREHRHNIVSGLQTELERQLGTREAIAHFVSDLHRAHLRLETVALPAGATAQQIGRQLARGISQALQR